MSGQAKSADNFSSTLALASARRFCAMHSRLSAGRTGAAAAALAWTAALLLVWGTAAVQNHHQFRLTHSSLSSSTSYASERGSSSPPVETPLQALKISDAASSFPGQELAISFDRQRSWKVDEQSLVSTALNKRYGADTTALDALQCNCTKSAKRESLLGAVDHTVFCDCL